jgi:hypothetical protein
MIEKLMVQFYRTRWSTGCLVFLRSSFYLASPCYTDLVVYHKSDEPARCDAFQKTDEMTFCMKPGDDKELVNLDSPCTSRIFCMDDDGCVTADLSEECKKYGTECDFLKLGPLKLGYHAECDFPAIKIRDENHKRVDNNFCFSTVGMRGTLALAGSIIADAVVSSALAATGVGTTVLPVVGGAIASIGVTLYFHNVAKWPGHVGRAWY